MSDTVVSKAEAATKKPRARDIGIPFNGVTGPWNAITDVPGIEVGYATLISGEPIPHGTPPAIRTGVTVIHPRGKNSKDPVCAGAFTLNGAGEMTGIHWVSESGFLESPIAITNTHSVGAVHSAIIKWQVDNDLMFGRFSIPVVAETFDGFLNDINGFHVQEKHVLAAINDAANGPIAEGNVGGGTGMTLFGLKGGSGTSSRVVQSAAGEFVIGAFAQGNFGLPHELIVAGVPIGKSLQESHAQQHEEATHSESGRGSIIVIVATNAPFLPNQLDRLAKRAALGIARTGGRAGHTSGDFILAFSTANPGVAESSDQNKAVSFLSNNVLDSFFTPVVEATEEAIINALIAADTMTGYEGHTRNAVPLEFLSAELLKHNRLAATT